MVSRLFFLFVLSLYGCPIMMPFMMGPMSSETMTEPDESKVDEAILGLIREGIAAFSPELEPYQEIVLGETTVTGSLLSNRKFRGMFLKELRSKDAFRVLDQGGAGAGGDQQPQPRESPHHELPPVVSTQLYSEDNMLNCV